MQHETQAELERLLKAKQAETMASEKGVKRNDNSKPQIMSIVSMPAVNFPTLEFQNSVVSEDMIRNIFREELNKLHFNINTQKNSAREKEQNVQSNNSIMSNQIKEAITIEVVNKNNGTKRDYKLDPQV